jgi:hypothetical protein
VSKFCPFCDDVKDSNLDTYEKFKQHLENEHGDQIIGKGRPERLEKEVGEVDEAVQAEFREVEESS